MNSFHDSIIENKRRVAIVSGATGGMGMAVCRQLLNDGFNVVMLGRYEEKLASAYQSLTQNEMYYARQLSRQCIDTKNANSVETTVEKVLAHFGRITDIIHAAGDGPTAPLLETDERMWDDTVQGKLMGTVRLTKAVTRHMVAQGFGNVVIVNGIFSQEADPLFPISSMVNSGLSGFAKAISLDLGRYGVRVNIVNPGATATPLWNDICNSIALRLGITAEQVNNQVINKIPAAKIADAENIASVIAFLLSPSASHIIGASINIDGGASTRV